MDQFVVDLGGDVVEVGSDAVLFGPGDRGEPSAEDWAEAAGTIAYEIVTRIGGRVPRVYVNETPAEENDAQAGPGRDPGRRERDPARSDLIQPDPARPASPDQT